MNDINRKKILLVEDETINARLGKRTLEKHGFEVIHANTGEGAVSAVESEPGIDLILMDIDLGPGIDGTAAAEIILKDNDIPLVFLSSHTEPEIVEKTEGITSYGYIVKNTGETVLLASMKMAFRLFDAKKKEEAKEQKLRDGEERYRSIFENTGTSMFLIGSDMTIEMVNDEFVCRFGYTRDEVSGRMKWTELVHPDYLDFMIDQHRLRRSNECAAARGYEIKYKTKSGEFRDSYLTVGMIPGTDQSIASMTDITDRKMAEQALHLKNEELIAVNEELAAMNEEFEAANEELIETNIQLELKEQNYRTLFENTGSGIIVIEEDTTISLANDKFSETVGYSRLELEGRIKWPSLVYEEDLERMLEQHRLRRKDPAKAESSYEFRFKIRSGELRDTLLFISMIPGTKKSIASLFDITDRKQAEDKLKISENKYRKIFENVQDVFYQTDITGTIIDISPSIEKYSGFKREELIGKPVQEVYCDPSDRDKLVHILLTQGKVLDYELRLKTKDERLVITSASSHIVFNSEGQPAGVEGSLRDITGRKEVEDEIRQAEMKYRTLVENLNEIIYRLDDKAVIDYVSPNLESLTGYKPEDVVGRNFIEFVHPDDVNGRIEQYNKIMSGISEVTEYRFIDKKGSIVWVRTSARVVYRDNAVTGIQGVLTDITDRKAVEDKVTSLLREKELLLIETHHRIKNNMNTVYGLLYMQAQELEDPVCIDIIHDAASRVQSMMILYDKLYHSDYQHKLNIATYLPALIDEIIGVFNPSVPVETDIKIEEFIMDAKTLSSLGIIINELITNSMKYAFREQDKGLVSISVSKNDNEVGITYKDNGPGLPESFTLENTAGFGMQLIVMLVQQLQGTLNIIRGERAEFLIKFKIEKYI